LTDVGEILISMHIHPLVKFTLLVGMWAVLNVYNKELVQNGEI